MVLGHNEYEQNGFESLHLAGRVIYMKKTIFVIICTVIIIFSMWSFFSIQREPDEIIVDTIVPEVKNIHDYINVSGRVKEGKKDTVYCENTYMVQKVYVNIGEFVEKGDVIADVVISKPVLHDHPFTDVSLDDVIEVFNDYNSLNVYPDVISRTLKISPQNSQIESPMSGIITEINLTEGENIIPLKKAFSVSDFSDLYVEIMIPEEYSSKIKENNTLELSVASLENKKYKGKIKNISPIAKYVPSLMGEGSTYIGAIAEIENIDSSLRPGLSVNAKIEIKTIKDALVLPYECILQDSENKEYVFCVKNNRAEKRHVVTGHEMSDGVEIKNGIQNNDVVIKSPSEELRDKAKIKKKKRT